MNFDNTSSILEPNESIIKTGLIILTTDEDDLRPVYLSGILTSGVRRIKVRDGENRKRFISF
jgi:hypothetical protein